MKVSLCVISVSHPHSRVALGHVRTLANLLVTNSEARKLLTDSTVVFRDLLARGASKAAEAIAPDPEQLATVDESGKRDEFIDRDEFGEKGEKLQDKVTRQKIRYQARKMQLLRMRRRKESSADSA